MIFVFNGMLFLFMVCIVCFQFYYGYVCSFFGGGGFFFPNVVIDKGF
jgi:hypothetical protein